MADLKEVAEWVDGIYQLEKDDPVEAGENGIDNLQAKQLANRTLFLKQKAEEQNKALENHATAVNKVNDDVSGLDSKAPVASPELTGIPKAPTATGSEQLQIVNVQYLADTLSLALLQFAQTNPESVEQMKKLIASKGLDEKFAALNALLNGLADRVAVLRTNDVDMWLAQAVTDSDGKIAYGVTQRGDFYQPAVTMQNDDNFPGWGMIDRRNRLLFGFHAPNGEMMLPGGHIGLSSDSPYTVTDKSGRVATHIKADGSVHFPGGIVDDSGIVYLRDGDVYRQQGGVITRITQRGDVVACQAYGQSVRYIAPRRGVMLTYEVSDGQTRQVFSDSSTDGFIVTGQSLAEGGANSAISKTAVAVGKAYMLDTGPVPNAARGAGVRPVELKEQIYETICSSFAAKDAQTNPRKIMMIGSAYGGKVFASLKKGGDSGVYEKIIKQIKTMLNFPFKPTYKALFVIHGEGDGNISNVSYDKNLAQWLDDFTADIQVLTGQKEQPVMLTCQTSSAAGYKKTAATRHQFTTPFLQLKASAEHPRIFLVCPKYQFSYKDYAHILANDTKWLGEYYAKVKKIVVDEGRDWLGLRPKALRKIDARTVEIEFEVPVAPLVFDVSSVSNPGNYGFSLYNAGEVTIASVELLAEQNKVRIVATDELPPTATITYAFDNGIGGKSGKTEGARGNLRDSDPAMSLDGKFNLYNWAFTFELPINQE